MFSHFQAIRSVIIPAQRLRCLPGNDLKALCSQPYTRASEGMSEIDELDCSQAS